MVRLVRRWGWALLLLPLYAGAAPPNNDEIEQKIGQLLERSGIEAGLEDLPDLMEEQIQQNPVGGVDPETVARITAIASAVFDPAALRKTLVDELRKSYDEKKFDGYLHLLDLPLVRKMAKLEDEASSPEALDALQDHARKLDAASPAPQRVQQIHDLMDASGSVELVEAMQVGLIEAFMRAMNPLVPPDRRLSDDQITQLLAQFKQQMGGSAREYLTLQNLYAYRNASDAELKEYVGLYRSESGRGLTAALNQAIIAMFKDVSAALARRISIEIATPKTSLSN